MCRKNMEFLLMTLFLLIIQRHTSISVNSDELVEDSSDDDTMDFSDEPSVIMWTEPMSDLYVQHTMHRIRDPNLSIPFYTEALGLTLLQSVTMSMDTNSNFTMYFLGYEDPDNIPINDEDRTPWAMSYAGAINLQYIWGSEDEPKYEYHDDNAFPTGHSHIGIFANDVWKFCDRLMQFNVTFLKKPDEGVVKGNAFILDPDGYWIEIMNPYRMTMA